MEINKKNTSKEAYAKTETSFKNAPILNEPILKNGRTINSKYAIIEELGKGAIGTVYKAIDIHTSTYVAIKFLTTNDQDHLILKQFIKEYENLQKINNKHIVSVYDLDEFEGIPYIVMEYMNGKDLEEILLKEGNLSWKKVVQWLIELCEGLDSAHTIKLIHGDLKLSNLFLVDGETEDHILLPIGFLDEEPSSITDDEQNITETTLIEFNMDQIIKIIDFGFSKFYANVEFPEKSEAKYIVGTPSYMAPELFMGAKINIQTDIYALGISAYKLFTGSVPFKSNASDPLQNLIELAKMHINNPIEPLTSFGLARPLSQIIEKTLHKDPKFRYNSITELKKDLEELIRPPPIPLSK